MKFLALRHARWFNNVHGVNSPQELRHWLVDRASLTQKLAMRTREFRVQRLRQERGYCLADEVAAVGLARRIQVQEREVLLHCDLCPMVFAHTVVPLSATASDWPFFGRLGDRSLGTTLFGDPRVIRGDMQFARLQATHPLVRRAARATGVQQFDAPLYARRCLYKRKRGVLLVTEVFLPQISRLSARISE
ncbi:MAG: chorismate lyase [Burkholderiales bacterium]|nr:chorismate lyase [Burkholderiales bacterium]